MHSPHRAVDCLFSEQTSAHVDKHYLKNQSFPLGKKEKKQLYCCFFKYKASAAFHWQTVAAGGFRVIEIAKSRTRNVFSLHLDALFFPTCEM